MNICVYGAASQQIHTDFLQGAHQLGHCLAKAGFGLVFGGGNTGVMGACARGAAQAGERTVSLPLVQSDDPVVVYKTLSAGYFQD